ncbi:MAG: hypothetical protein PHY54_04750 [Methylococcales bacterium]|nr:hypothetical protein [Methylococcales bacterium]
MSKMSHINVIEKYEEHRLGRQICKNVPGSHFKSHPKTGVGVDRSNRPYYILARKTTGVVVTEPYLSSVRRELCLSTSVKIVNDDGST